jgi:Coenzyme PQQ synthesis protein D (PqqD)
VSEPRFRVSPEIVHETVDGEVIAIDLGNGSYYSLAGSGPAIWELLLQGATAADIEAAMTARFAAGEGEIGPAVGALLEQLGEHGLVVSDESGGAESRAVPASNGERSAFEAPRLERYNDMKDYFLLDPIHEVDTAGWPRPAA